MLALLSDLGAERWLLGGLAALLVGVAKTGVPGFGILAVPVMVHAAPDARASAGWLLPLLCAADAFAIGYYRRHARLGVIAGLVPWVAVGMAGGLAALALPDRPLRLLVASIVLAMLVLRVRQRLLDRPPEPRGRARTAAYGITAGFATTVANAAGAVMNLYLLGQRLPKEQFMGVGAWFFFFINLSKLPLYYLITRAIAPGAAAPMIDGRSLLLDLTWLPLVAVGALLGRAVFLRLPQRRFESVVLGLTAAATLLLFVR